MSITVRNQRENGIFLSRKQIRNHVKYVEKVAEDFEEICSNCNDCKQAILLSNGVFCGKLREQVSNILNCPHFDLEPAEYKLYRRI